jgi:glycosyltransferase involved in cell wall biosynthesis
VVRIKSDMKVCVVIPAYNEEKIIGDVIADVFKTFEKASFALTVVVVDDGSKDNTAEIAKKHGAVVIQHFLNTGAGGATATGLSYAHQNQFDIAVTMDADGQHVAPDVLAGVKIASLGAVDLLIGSRLINSEGMSKVKILGNKGLSAITYLLFGVSSTDSQSGLRVLSRSALEQLRWKTSGYEFASEMLWRAKQLGLTISEYPIHAIYTDYSKSKGQNNWNAINILKSLLRHRLVEMFE